MSSLFARIIAAGPAGVAKALAVRGMRMAHRARTAWATEYASPNPGELARIEGDCAALGMPCADYRVDVTAFRDFMRAIGFPADYHGGLDGGVFEEKLLEHYVAWQLLGLEQAGNGPYLDIAAAQSPWTRLLRARGIEAYALDLDVPAGYRHLDYYLLQDATATSFADGSIGSASLQCAYEMFAGDDDIRLVVELARILRPGGRVVISPLYMHTHACHYQSPEHYGRTPGDDGATRYVRRDIWGVPSSRKYSAATLRSRVWDRALASGLQPRLYVLRNKADVSPGIYLHFILVLDKPAGATPTPTEAGP